MNMAATTAESFREFIRTRSAVRPASGPRAPRHPLSPEIFTGMMTKERKRADRTDQPCPVVKISVADSGAPTSPYVWKPIVEAVSTTTRETDLIGWLPDHTLGAVLTEVESFDEQAAEHVGHRLTRAITRTLEPQSASTLSIRVLLASQKSPDTTVVPLRSSGAYEIVKRAIDIAGSLFLLLLLSPLFLAIAVLVKLGSPGPIFFGQPRVGQMMKPFRMQKFRTMKVDADQALHRQYVESFIKAAANPQPSGQTAIFKLTNDPRVTRVGRVLRSTSLDELPQLWNVLRGEMSLVGPRPPIPYELEQYKPWHCRRILEAKPGMTGLWQVKGRSRTTFDDMVRLDLRYAKTRSFWTDLRILFATPRAVISGKGAC